MDIICPSKSLYLTCNYNLGLGRSMKNLKRQNECINAHDAKTLWLWADKNNIPDLTFHKGSSDDLDTWDGFPRDLEQLLALKELDLSHCGLSDLPEEFRFLSLTSLNLYGNEFHVLPKAITQITTLTELWLNRNHLSELPEEIGNLSNLEFLGLSSNQLKELPHSFKNLKKLRKLWLDANCFSSIPQSIWYLMHLKLLYLSDNLIDEIPAKISELTHLEKFWTENNKLVSLPESICKLKNLQRVNFSQNDIAYSTAQLQWIKQLSALGCKIELNQYCPIE